MFECWNVGMFEWGNGGLEFRGNREEGTGKGE